MPKYWSQPSSAGVPRVAQRREDRPRDLVGHGVFQGVVCVWPISADVRVPTASASGNAHAPVSSRTSSMAISSLTTDAV